MFTISGAHLDFTGNLMFVTATERLDGAAGPVENVVNRTVPMPAEVAALRSVIEAAYAAALGVAPEAVTSAVMSAVYVAAVVDAPVVAAPAEVAP